MSQRTTSEVSVSTLTADGQRLPAAGAEMQARVEQDASPHVVSRAFDAIEAVFASSPNPELTRQGLRGFVDMIADTKQQSPTEAHPGVTA